MFFPFCLLTNRSMAPKDPKEIIRTSENLTATGSTKCGGSLTDPALPKRYMPYFCSLQTLTDCSIYFLFGTVFIQFQYFFRTNIDILTKRLSQLKLQFKYQKLFNCCIYPSLLVREGSNKESTYTSDIHVPLNFYMIF